MTTPLSAAELSASRAFHRHRDAQRREAREERRRERLAAARRAILGAVPGDKIVLVERRGRFELEAYGGARLSTRTSARRTEEW